MSQRSRKDVWGGRATGIPTAPPLFFWQRWSAFLFQDGKPCLNPNHIRTAEIHSFEKQWLARYFRNGIGTAIAEVQCRPMVPFAESAPCVPGHLEMVRCECHYLNLSLVKKEVEFAPARLSLAGFNYHRRLKRCNAGDQPYRIVANQVQKPLSVGFLKQDCRERRSVDDHALLRDAMLVVPDNLFWRARIQVGQGGATIADSAEFICELGFTYASLFAHEPLAKSSQHSFC